MQARYYDPVTGRFLSIDPVQFSANMPFMFNRYAYVGGDPVNMVDPDGRQAHEVRTFDENGTEIVYGPYSNEELAKWEMQNCGDDCSGRAEPVDIPTPASAGVGATKAGVKAVVKETKKQRRARIKKERKQRRDNERASDDQVEYATRNMTPQQKREFHDAKKGGEADRSKKQVEEDVEDIKKNDAN